MNMGSHWGGQDAADLSYFQKSSELLKLLNIHYSTKSYTQTKTLTNTLQWCECVDVTPPPRGGQHDASWVPRGYFGILTLYLGAVACGCSGLSGGSGAWTRGVLGMPVPGGGLVFEGSWERGSWLSRGSLAFGSTVL